MGNLPKGASGSPTKSVGNGSTNKIGIKIWDGSSSATSNIESPGMAPVSANHGGIQQPSSKGVVYKGVSTDYC